MIFFMNEPLPAESLALTTKEGKRFTLQVFGVDQLARAIIGRERISSYTPIDEIRDPNELDRRRRQFDYSLRYLSFIISSYGSDQFSQILSALKEEFVKQAEQKTGDQFLDDLSQPCRLDEFSQSATSLANLAARLMVLETLTHPPPGVDQKTCAEQTAKLLEESLVKIDSARLVGNWTEEKGFFSSSRKILEYVERMTRVKSGKKEQKYSNDTSDSVEKDLARFGYDYQRLVRDRETRYQFPRLDEIIGASGFNARALGEYALVSRTAPILQEFLYQPLNYEGIQITRDGRIIFPHIPNLSFAADKLLMACLTCEGGKIFYPHLDDQGRIKSVTVFHFSEPQTYAIRRKCEEVLRKSGEQSLGRLKREKGLKGGYIARQQEGGQIVIEGEGGKIVRTFSDGLLNFPLGHTSVDFCYSKDPNVYAAYSRIGAFILGKKFLEHIRYPDNAPGKISSYKRALMVARHELNHAFWDKLDGPARKKIMDFFTLDSDSFLQFVMNFVKVDEYREAALRDYQQNPNQEYLEVPYKNATIKLAKERIVNELLAYASEREVLTDEELQLSGSNQAVTLATSAISCLRSLSPEVLTELEEKSLVFERGSDDFNNFFNAFLTAIKILSAEHL